MVGALLLVPIFLPFFRPLPYHLLTDLFFSSIAQARDTRTIRRAFDAVLETMVTGTCRSLFRTPACPSSPACVRRPPARVHNGRIPSKPFTSLSLPVGLPAAHIQLTNKSIYVRSTPTSPGH
ncbi:hypothetical protein C8R45DRAFT_1104199 [Mycena sanguinolenta]|nr:hypothetical protein C8R45DRAFT_1104199 [Mycena sanguinolenta]